MVAGDRAPGAGRGGRGHGAAPLARGAGRAAPPDRRLAQAQGVNTHTHTHNLTLDPCTHKPVIMDEPTHS